MTTSAGQTFNRTPPALASSILVLQLLRPLSNSVKSNFANTHPVDHLQHTR
jgi:hypothetical protein